MAIIHGNTYTGRLGCQLTGADLQWEALHDHPKTRWCSVKMAITKLWPVAIDRDWGKKTSRFNLYTGWCVSSHIQRLEGGPGEHGYGVQGMLQSRPFVFFRPGGLWGNSEVAHLSRIPVCWGSKNSGSCSAVQKKFISVPLACMGKPSWKPAPKDGRSIGQLVKSK